EVHPKSYIAHYNLGICWAQRKQFVEAISPLKEAIRLFPGFNVAAMELIKVYELSGSHEEARRLSKIYATQNPFDRVGRNLYHQLANAVSQGESVRRESEVRR